MESNNLRPRLSDDERDLSFPPAFRQARFQEGQKSRLSLSESADYNFRRQLTRASDR